MEGFGLGLIVIAALIVIGFALRRQQGSAEVGVGEDDIPIRHGGDRARSSSQELLHEEQRCLIDFALTRPLGSACVERR